MYRDSVIDCVLPIAHYLHALMHTNLNIYTKKVLENLDNLGEGQATINANDMKGCFDSNQRVGNALLNIGHN